MEEKEEIGLIYSRLNNPDLEILENRLCLWDGAEDCGCDFREGSRCDNFSQLWYPYAQSKLSKSSLQV